MQGSRRSRSRSQVTDVGPCRSTKQECGRIFHETAGKFVSAAGPRDPQWPKGTVMKSVWRTSESEPVRALRPVPAPKRQRTAKASPRDEARQLLFAHEEERRRLSLALHDSMTQSLAALATNVDLIERSAAVLSPRTRAIVAETRFIARQCFQQVRRLTDHLYPPLVAEVGLPLALRCTVANFAERTGARITCQSDDCPRLPLEIEIALFRVVEDCLSTLHQLARGNASITLAIN